MLQNNNYEDLIKKFTEFSLKYPRKYCSIVQAEDCSGDYISNAQRCINCFNVGDAQDLQYCDSVYRAKDCLDVSSFGEEIERINNSETIGNRCFNIHFSYNCVSSCSDLYYCLNCHQTKNSFGCIGLRNENYCILNKKYSKEEYEELVPKIIEHMRSIEEWGRFFPVRLSPFGYNETIAQEYFPMTKEEVLAKNWEWTDKKNEVPKAEKTVPAEKVPLSIKDIPDQILKFAIICKTTGKPFLITKQELSFYRKMQISVPHYHPDERHKKRMELRNPRKLWNRICDNCGKSIQSSYNSNRPEIIYCEDCYLKEVY